MEINALINASLHTGKSPHPLKFKGKKVLIKLSDTSPPLPAGTLLARDKAGYRPPMVFGVEGGGEDFRLIAEVDIQAKENYVYIYIYIYFKLEKLRK